MLERFFCIEEDIKPMKIRLISDIHLEFANFKLPVMEGEDEQYLCICGDLNPFRYFEQRYGHKKSTEVFFNSLQNRFKDIFYVPGNHEYYYTELEKEELYKSKCEELGVHLLQNSFSVVTYDNIVFIGGTLWTDFDNENPISMSRIQGALNDYHCINTRNCRFTVHEALNLHRQQKEHIFKVVRSFRETYPDFKIVVLSHHAPHPWSIGEKFKTSMINGAFCSDLDQEIMESGPDLWLHGHCVDLNTEVLTESGWKYREELEPTDNILTLNPESNLLEVSKIDRIIDITYSGEVYSYTGRGVNFRVTKGHCIFARNYQDTKYIEEPVQVFQNRKTAKFIRSGNLYTKGTGLNPNILELYYAFAADGDICKRATTGLVRFCVHKEKKLEYLENLLIRCNIPYKPISRGFSFYLPDELKGFKIKGLDDFILNSTPEECEITLKAYANTDGNKNGNQVTIYSSKKEEIDKLQYMFTINGYKTNCCWRDGHGFSKNRSYQLNVSKGKTTTYQPCYNEIKVETTLIEHFWCLQTKNKNFFIRRNGKIHLTGNCHNSVDYQLYGTRVVCNPRGYCKYKPENPSFNPELVIEV